MTASKLAVFVVGTRAQLIKVAPVVVECQRAGVPGMLLMTGQHQETIDDLVQEFGITMPRRDAVAVRERATVGALVGWLPRICIALPAALRRLRREHGALDVVVHGDTLSTLLGAVAGRLAGARVLHLESGLTSGRLFDPFPEELTRRLVFRLAHVALCPDATAANHLRSLRLRRLAIVDTGGNTILDAVRLVDFSRASHAAGAIVASLHRFQNLYDENRLRMLVDTVERAAQVHPVVFVLHPSTRKRLAATGLLERLQRAERVTVSPRLPYADFLRLAAGAECVLTDGGSNQEELAALGVPTVIMRRHTERPDGLGGNARMEASIDGDLVDWLRQGGHRELRRPALQQDGPGPSARVAQLLGA